MLDMSCRTAFNEDHAMFRNSVRKLFGRMLVPNLDRREREGIVEREFWLACGEAGLLCPTVKPEHGGPGLDFGYNAAVTGELANCLGAEGQATAVLPEGRRSGGWPRSPNLPRAKANWRRHIALHRAPAIRLHSTGRSRWPVGVNSSAA